MVDIQLISITLAASSIIIAASYYVMNIREIRHGRQITLTTTVLEPFMTIEGNQQFLELTTMTWNDLDDYKKKYDHRVNPDNFAKRMSMWNRCNTLGALHRKRLLDLDTLYAGSSRYIIWLWFKFKPIIEKYRGADFEENAYEDWEYLAESLLEHLDSQIGRGEYLDEYIEKPGTTI